MEVLCFDIGSGGITVACINERLDATAVREISWEFHRDASGSATLPAEDFLAALEQLVPEVTAGRAVAAVCAGCFMHSYLVLSSCCAPLTSISTWLETAGTPGVEFIRERLGARFHQETGCRYHPAFPVFRLAATPPGRGNRVASPKAFLIQELAGVFMEDVGMASASGMLNVHSGSWHEAILDALGLEHADLPVLGNPDEIAGKVTAAAARRFGISEATPVILGSGDGFLANVGSGCATPSRLSVTLGTSGVVRRIAPNPVLNDQAGTFCYRASTDRFLLGCASNNGGNTLDWGRRSFGPLQEAFRDVPIFVPWLHGERSFEWDPHLTASFHGVSASHDPASLARAVAEGVLFNLAQYVERVFEISGSQADDVVLSGNGFLEPILPPMFAQLVGRRVVLPGDPGLATLRGAAVHAWRAVGHDPMPHIERLLQDAEDIRPAGETKMLDRYARFKELRRSLASREGGG